MSPGLTAARPMILSPRIGAFNVPACRHRSDGRFAADFLRNGNKVKSALSE